MYGPTAGAGRDMADELRAIAVDPIPDRFGHYLGNELIFQLNGSGAPAPVKYRLLVTYQNRVQTPIVDTVTGRADSATVWAEVLYSLTPAAGGRPVAEGRVASAVDYDRSANRYANLRAARDAEIRAAKSLADQIRLRVAADLANRPD
jgi:LPS-assembly lipoprotein